MATKKKTSKKSPPPFKVMETDGHNTPTVYVFRDKEHFFQWIQSDDLSFDREKFENGEWTDDNGVTWCEFTGLCEIDLRNEGGSSSKFVPSK